MNQPSEGEGIKRQEIEERIWKRCEGNQGKGKKRDNWKINKKRAEENGMGRKSKNKKNKGKLYRG